MVAASDSSSDLDVCSGDFVSTCNLGGLKKEKLNPMSIYMTRAEDKTKKENSQHDRSYHSYHDVPGNSSTNSSNSAGDNGFVLSKSISGQDRRGQTLGKLLHPLNIVEAQIAATEVRGGQAGGISSIEFESCSTQTAPKSQSTRVRIVATKRVPLSHDLVQTYRKRRNISKSRLSSVDAMTFLGHTRFATSSVNRVEELHPHEWVPFHQEEARNNTNQNRLYSLLSSLTWYNLIISSGDYVGLVF